MSTDFIEDELARLRRDVDEIKASINNGSSGKTTKAQRLALRKHVEELDKILKEDKQPKKVEVKNTFAVGQVVELIEFKPNRTKGIVKYLTCKDALPSSRAAHARLNAVLKARSDTDNVTEVKGCDKNCKHQVKPVVWVIWPDEKTFGYNFKLLRQMTEEELKPRIGKELSGRIGPWVYNAETKLWKRDGSDKLYSTEEFEDVMFWEMNPQAAEEGKDFLKSLSKK